MTLRSMIAAVILLPLVGTAQAQDSAGIRAFRRYDFVPGERIIRFDDFLQDAIGDFPAGWNTNAAAEVVTIEGKEGRWLSFTRGGVFVPDLSEPLPDNFTLEFDVLASQPFLAGDRFSIADITALVGIDFGRVVKIRVAPEQKNELIFRTVDVWAAARGSR